MKIFDQFPRAYLLRFIDLIFISSLSEIITFKNIDLSFFFLYNRNFHKINDGFSMHVTVLKFSFAIRHELMH